MSMGCTAARELFPELVLGSLDGAVRADVLGHVATCPACRAEVRDLADVVDALALFVPTEAPPSGFEGRVLDAIAATPTAAPASRQPRRWAGRRLLAAAVAAAVLAVAGTGVVLATRSGGGAFPINARNLRSAEMIGAGTAAVGAAYVSTGETPWILVDVRYGLKGAAYRLVGVTADGAVVDIGKMRAIGPQWAWAGRVDAAASLTELRVVDEAGAVACRATFAR
jgi:hypothetical protein